MNNLSPACHSCLRVAGEQRFPAVGKRQLLRDCFHMIQGLANIRDGLHQIFLGSMHRGEVKDDLSGVFGGPANGSH
jgi:hypothetical protein